MISIVMPAHNEEGYLRRAVETTVTGLRERGTEFEIVISENGSSDGTAEEAAALEIAFSEVTVLCSPVADYGHALHAGFDAARGDIVVNFDVDLVDLRFLDRALSLLASSSAAVVVGSKRAEGAKDERGPARQVVTAVFSLVLRAAFGLGVSDTHGLKALVRKPLLPVVASCRFGQDIFDTELVIRADRSGLEVAEIPVTVAEQRPPRTPIAKRIPRSLWGIARLRVSLWREGVGKANRA